ncbi:hypothetical protein F5050DRAFT_1716696, partial [Lentinula boryana]
RNDTSAEREKGRKVEVMGEVNKHDNESDDDEDDDQTDDLFPAALLDLSINKNTAANRVLQSMYTITAWLVSSNSLSTRARNLIGKEMKVNMYCCPEVQPMKYDVAMKAQLNDLFPKLGLLTGQRNFQKLASRCGKAKVHAEAALMAWIYGNDHSEAFGMDVAIAVNLVDSHSRESSEASEDLEEIQLGPDPELDRVLAEYIRSKKGL